MFNVLSLATRATKKLSEFGQSQTERQEAAVQLISMFLDEVIAAGGITVEEAKALREGDANKFD